MTPFFAALDDLVAACPISIDRPRGSAHPLFPNIVYPVDYGYLDGSTAMDGQGVDVFRGTSSGAGVVGAVVTVDSNKRDVEIKVLVDCLDTEIDVVHDFLASRLHLSAYVIRP